MKMRICKLLRQSFIGRKKIGTKDKKVEEMMGVDFPINEVEEPKQAEDDEVGGPFDERIKKKVLDVLVGYYKVEYAKLYKYVQEIKTSNLGTSCIVKPDSFDECDRMKNIRFFLLHMGCYGVREQEQLGMVSQGLDAAIQVELPKIEHKMCTRHIDAQWVKEIQRGGEKNYFLAYEKSYF
ncbi:conserved hypothetical protein [Ricinus communis]|uniref:Uncharacterized protein n=1 Tax=Ricinus communis TaxID=3988 RepID=B9T5M3_RICCO|nr:conserved hypothetical protein [Ricinus communis]